MKINLLFFLLLVPFALLAQAPHVTIEGTVIDSASGVPLQQVSVFENASANGTLTDENGRYSLVLTKPGRLRFSYLGYGTKTVRIEMLSGDQTINMRLSVLPYYTPEINVTARKMYKLDSINFRKANSDIFTASKVRAGGVTPAAAHTADYGPNILLSPSVLYNNYISSRARRLRTYRKTLETAEKQTYIDSRYNEQVITGITGLKGAALDSFMVENQPAYDWLIKSSDYDLYSYIKEKFKGTANSAPAAIVN